MRIGIAGFAFSDSNKGCEALTYTFLSMLQRLFPSETIEVMNVAYSTNFGLFKEKYPDHLDEIKSYMQGWTRNKTITRDYNQKQAVTALEKAYSDSNTENDFIEMKQQFAEALNAAINELFC